MRSQTRLDLAGKDALTLEVVVPDALRLPIGQLAPISVAEMMALAASEQVPSALKSGLDGFCKRMEAEIADLPEASLVTFAETLGGHDAAQVPERLRAAVHAAAGKVSSVARHKVDAGTTAWAEAPPTAFEVGQGKGPKVVRTEQTRAEASTSGKSSSGATKERAAPAKRTRTKVIADPEQTRWIEGQVLERLAGRSENGLAEVVLIAGIRHAARGTYPHLTAPEVTAVLKGLKESGRVRHSAGRWSVPGRW